jgi:hypothetical protein
MDSAYAFWRAFSNIRDNKEPRHLNGDSGRSVSATRDSLVIWHTENPES